VDLENFETSGYVWRTEPHMAMEATWTQQFTVNSVKTVCGSNDEDLVQLSDE
jgi:hypothetical protein